jgi:pimeloyl-ACP methyl ester carboxylesterase
MIVITCRVHLKQLGIANTFRLVLPDAALEIGERLPYVVCLHGYGQSGERLLNEACFGAVVDERRVALLLPNGQNSCFMNMAHGPNWETYLLDGLMPFAERTFPLCGKPRLLGVGTGGWAASRLIAAYPDRFTASIAVDARRDLQEAYANGELLTMPDLEAAFGDPAEMARFPLCEHTRWVNGVGGALTQLLNIDGSTD